MPIGPIVDAVDLGLGLLVKLKRRYEREKLRIKVNEQDGEKLLTVEKCAAVFLLTAEEMAALNSALTSREEKARIYVSAQERTEAYEGRV